jgi:predicted  nucleic acid-binding Zn-ribbon protein
LKLQSTPSLKNFIHDNVRRLLELHGLEERLAALKRDPDERANAEALIESLRANLPMGVLMVHDQMRSREKRSVAEVRHGVCAGCHLALGVGNVAALRTGEMRRCGNCGRFVYVVEADEADAAASSQRRTKQPARSAKLVPSSR